MFSRVYQVKENEIPVENLANPMNNSVGNILLIFARTHAQTVFLTVNSKEATRDFLDIVNRMLL